MDRRDFLHGSFVTTFAILTARCGNSPVGPTVVERPPVTVPLPAAPTNNPSSQYGTFFRSGRAGINGSLEEVLRSARLISDDDIKMDPLYGGEVIRIGGHEPALVPGSNTLRGFFFHVNGQPVGTNAQLIRLSRDNNDEWVAFSWNGKA